MAWKRSGASISRSMMKCHTRLLSALTSSCKNVQVSFEVPKLKHSQRTTKHTFGSRGLFSTGTAGRAGMQPSQLRRKHVLCCGSHALGCRTHSQPCTASLPSGYRTSRQPEGSEYRSHCAWGDQLSASQNSTAASMPTSITLLSCEFSQPAQHSTRVSFFDYGPQDVHTIRQLQDLQGGPKLTEDL